MCVIIAITGLGGAGFPAILEGTIETIYPVPEATAMGILFLGLNITGVVFVLLMEELKDPNGSMIKSMWGVVFLCMIGISAVFFFKSDYRRLHFEREVAQQQKERKELKQEVVHSPTPYTSFHS